MANKSVGSVCVVCVVEDSSIGVGGRVPSEVAMSEAAVDDVVVDEG